MADHYDKLRIEQERVMALSSIETQRRRAKADSHSSQLSNDVEVGLAKIILDARSKFCFEQFKRGCELSVNVFKLSLSDPVPFCPTSSSIDAAQDPSDT
ncbi:hypothetical protein KKF55_02015 [Patescibacteria group bacterium]|nr:hypothetical protein [Patescibacteria group bacterium]